MIANVVILVDAVGRRCITVTLVTSAVVDLVADPHALKLLILIGQQVVRLADTTVASLLACIVVRGSHPDVV